MKHIFLLFLIFSLSSNAQNLAGSKASAKNEISHYLNLWHKAAATANFEQYFNLMTKDAIFIGTDATENWQNEDFKKFSKPYFDQGKAWNFAVLQRNIYLGENGSYAWFDELLDTQMGICRGSGVLEYKNNEWKIKHYVLSITIPNENVEEVTALKKSFDKHLKLQIESQASFLQPTGHQ
ncbi:nuclear transport factor 2 family protein [Autumnicola musiva]|uniref:Nuclear transport factor 2 family protein n=1 Tax=Autumnicola musiva TaxID=3075589 RepID=A0ABU3D0W2_9FLAO|nr:nuclear transport factor 2 family protein [Zunongwangia sp. F117]MDT0675179.1 nuclear transport factor 2 family protein [Zunongwangia sp. F117]